MKRKFIPIVAFCFSTITGSVFAQSNEEANTLLKNKLSINSSDLGFMFTPSYGLSNIDESNVSLFNLRGGVVLKDRFSFGGYYNLSVNEINPRSETVPNVYMDYWSAGAFFEYTLFSKKLIHLTLPISVGLGEVQMDNESGDAGLGEKQFFQIEPALLLEMNLHKHMRLNLGASYRIVENMTYRNLNQDDISGFNLMLGLKFGLFRWQ